MGPLFGKYSHCANGQFLKSSLTTEFKNKNKLLPSWCTDGPRTDLIYRARKHGQFSMGPIQLLRGSGLVRSNQCWDLNGPSLSSRNQINPAQLPPLCISKLVFSLVSYIASFRCVLFHYFMVYNLVTSRVGSVF